MGKSKDLYTFIAGKALENNNPFILNCNCSGTIAIYQPLQEDRVICPQCESVIHILVVEGDPGYIIGQSPEGKPMLLPVQGSSAPPINSLSKEDQEKIISDILLQMEGKK